MVPRTNNLRLFMTEPSAASMEAKNDRPIMRVAVPDQLFHDEEVGSMGAKG